MGPRKKSHASAQAHIWADITQLDPLLNRSCVTLRDANNQYKDPSRSHPRLRHKDPPKPATPTLLTTG